MQRFQLLHCPASYEKRRIRSMLVARSRLVSIRRDIENQVRSMTKEYGLLFRRTVALQFRKQVTDLLGERHQLHAVIEPPLYSRASLHAAEQIRRRRASAGEIRQNNRRLMTVPGVGAVTALTFRHTIDDPSCFR
jgi:transposase